MDFIQNQGLSISFEDIGTGRTIVLGHSFLCSGKMWREQIPALAESHRVLNLDLRGHGNSGEVTEPFSLYDAVSDVVAVLDERGVEKAVWCGLSIGGMVALRAALTCPERVEGLILMDTDAGAEHPYRKLRNYLLGLGAQRLGIGPFLPSIVRLMFGSRTRRQNPALVREWKEEFLRVHLPSILLCLETLMKRDSLLARLHEINVPTLVLVGEEDRSLPPSLSSQIHDLLPDSELIQIPGAGHLSALERPTAVNGAVIDFIERRFS